MKDKIMPVSRLIFILISIYFTTFLLWPYYIDFRITENMGLNPQRFLIVIIVFFSLLYLFLVRGEEKNHLMEQVSKHKAIFVALSLYFVLRIPNVFYSEKSIYSLLVYTNDFFHIFLLIGITLIIANSIKRLRFLLLLIFISGLVASLYVILEYILQSNLLAQLANPSTKAGEIALSVKTREGIYRAQGLFEHPITQAQVLVVILISSYFVVTGRVFWFCLPLFMLAIFYTGSRFGLTVALMFLGLMLLTNIKRYVLHIRLLVFSLAIAFAVFLLYQLVFNASVAQNSSSLTRVAQFHVGVKAILDSPVWGYGIGFAGETLLIFSNPIDKFVIYRGSVDNYFLTITIESGLLALIGFIYLLYISWRASTKEVSSNYMKLFPVLGYLSFMILSIFHVVFFVILIPLLVGLYLEKLKNYNAAITNKGGIKYG